jgi:SAM-dependent methyltransferase
MGDLPVGELTTAELNTAELGVEYRTRPDCPMIGPYSINQMDDFYAALALGQVKASGVMNYLQHLYIAERCQPGEALVDVCCGRGLQLPVLYRYAPHLAAYVGVDISPANLDQARQRIRGLDGHYTRDFKIRLLEHDVAQPWPELGPFQVAVYTSALEHLPSGLGIASLRHTAAALAPGGRLYLSTPSAPGPPPRPLQYHVHVYEWNYDELAPVLSDCGLEIEETIGLLPPEPDQLAAELDARFGPGAGAWYQHARERIPAAFLDAVAAVAAPGVAAELLYVCRRQT